MNTLFPASSIARLPLFRFASMFGFLDVSCVCFFVSPCRRSDARLAPYGGAGRPLVLYATLRFNGGRFSCPVFPRRRPTFPFPPCCLACRHPAGDGRARARCRGHPASSVGARPPRLPPRDTSTPHGQSNAVPPAWWPVDTVAPVVVCPPPVKGGHWDLNTCHHYSGHVNNLCLLQTSCNNED